MKMGSKYITTGSTYPYPRSYRTVEDVDYNVEITVISSGIRRMMQ